MSKVKQGLEYSSLKINNTEKSFIPNTFLTTIEQPELTPPDESFTDFKKKHNFLNYFSTENDYEIKMYKATQ